MKGKKMNWKQPNSNWSETSNQKPGSRASLFLSTITQIKSRTMACAIGLLTFSNSFGQTPSLKWSSPTAGPVDGSAAIAMTNLRAVEGIRAVYITSRDGHLYSLDLVTGAQ